MTESSVRSNVLDSFFTWLGCLLKTKRPHRLHLSW